MAKKSYKSMDDFASASGVSRPTLSKYFDDPSQIKEVTRKRIEAALKKSHFEPNLFARHLNRKRTRNIGILVPTMSDPFYVQVVSLIELELREKGFWPVQISSHTRPELEAEAVRTLLSLKVAGAIVAPLGAGSRRSALERLRDAIPVVCFDNPADADLPYVGNDNAQSMAAIVQYLCRSGEPPIFLEIPHMTENAGERQAGYRATMAREGHSPLVIDCDAPPSWEFERLGYEQMQRILANGGLPGKTLLCANDRFAFGAMAAAFASGLKIGRNDDCDVRIAGHDDHPLSRYTCPSLTTMAQNAPEIAAKSVELLLAHIESEDDGTTPVTNKVILEATLVMRESA
ncbi:LacI family DNA-binding transcriptional regulator [Rhizobium sp. 25PS6]|uniref:LacI family DNA-binding transcriptional regulator n=1 Tax=Rhizobium TaxID=379 RepID=UPI00103EE1C8|nr:MULTISPECIES: LacI family DNA-binding transcriptional regulator [Rhizobium]MBY3181595.1 LacI family transcriptional regulator [Rhizobium laguerreae]MBY3236844.1 LacI family transcriptional regulator [Rhizobium laguerreae]MBY5835448.1 LacI family transcriptional regulator [Rhizobium leguminosarum]MDU0359253.1 LacI family DNA-binding transcriptional regulator [Rhizobium sp. 25PS6]NKK96746.1 substrate-binding domain-containing protein [Rhizobium leguminosarum bv. viciae]